jgi:hypothetical protein
MIASAELKNFGPISELKVDAFSNINLLIGPNRSGKTFLLKSLYAVQRTVELTGRGKNNLSASEMLARKLRWLFEVERLGVLVRKPVHGPLSFAMADKGGGKFSFSFGADTVTKINNVVDSCPARSSNSVFIPAKEVLSLLDVIKFNREQRMEFGFDDTYYDLAAALTPPIKGKLAQGFARARESLGNVLGGRIRFNKDKKLWEYEQGKMVFDISVTSEGTKKLAIFDTLIGNHYLSRESLVFIDEPEAGLHPRLLIGLLDIVSALAEAGVQFFIASHSYFVIKKLYLLAHQKRMSVPVVSFDCGNDGMASIFDLREGMPENPIIDESIRLYEEEIGL